MLTIHDTRYDKLDVIARSLINRRNHDLAFSNLEHLEILYVVIAANRFDLLANLHHTIVSAIAELYSQDEKILDELLSRWRAVPPWSASSQTPRINRTTQFKRG